MLESRADGHYVHQVPHRHVGVRRVVDLFHRDAPITVRIGAIGVFLLAAADATSHIRWSWSMPTGAMTFWAAALRAAVSVAVGLFFALGIARLNRVRMPSRSHVG